MAGIYIHIPFCKQACFYCDFHFSTNQDLRDKLCFSIVEELKLQSNYLDGEPVETIYFGGGTPSLLAERELDLIMSEIIKSFSVVSHPEVTLEANPDDLTLKKLVSIASSGINRLSIGIQSFDKDVLIALNRVHTVEQAVQCIEDARKAGISNLNVDVIYSIPGQSISSLQSTLKQITDLSTPHISAYSLTVEEKTVFGKWAKTGKFKELDNSLSADQFELVMDYLGESGYEQYEISNFCLSGMESKHNSSYWKQRKYLGVGPSAHSFNGVSRQHNLANNALYIKNIDMGIVRAEVEVLSRENKINEYIFTSLRTKRGCYLPYLKATYNFDLLAENNDVSKKFLDDQLIEIQGDNLFLTRKGKFLADHIASEFFADS